jgi:transposase InsO family protein
LKATRELIGRICSENPLWGAPRLHGELLKLGIEISEASVSRYMAHHPRPQSQTWRTFLKIHMDGLASIDLFVVPTATFRLMYAFVVLHHWRRRIVHFGVTPNPTAAWVAQQITEAFPWDTLPRYLIHDRDAVYGALVRGRLRTMGIEEVVTAPRSPWQNPFAERVIGSIRRECLDHVIIFNERHLQRLLSSYVDYYHRSRTHLALDQDAPDGRPVQWPGDGRIVAFPQVGGLHHRYERLAA